MLLSDWRLREVVICGLGLCALLVCCCRVVRCSQVWAQRREMFEPHAGAITKVVAKSAAHTWMSDFLTVTQKVQVPSEDSFWGVKRGLSTSLTWKVLGPSG